MGDEQMTVAERTHLCAIIRQRERVAKSEAAQHAADQRAAFERELDTTYPFDRDETWTALRIEADRLTAEIRAGVAERARELGIPDRFAPSMSIYWNDGRGEKMSKYRSQLRRLAHSHIEAAERSARVEIEMASVKMQDEIVSTAITSEQGQNLLARLPSIEQLMLPVELASMEVMLDRKTSARLLAHSAYPGGFAPDD